MYRHLVKRKKLHNKHLQSAFEKYVFENFNFELLEECSKDISIYDLHQLEQSYINSMHPEYNKRTIVDTNHLLNHSLETKNKISESLKKSFKNGTKIINRIQPHNIKVSLFDLSGNHIQDFPGLAHCAEFIGCSATSIKRATESRSRRIKNYIVLRTEDSVMISNFTNTEIKKLGKEVIILNILDNTLTEFPNAKECLKFIKCKKTETVKKFYETGKIWKKMYKIIKYG
jgi:group I intron endonuclease